jgi:hypothetical protein
MLSNHFRVTFEKAKFRCFRKKCQLFKNAPDLSCQTCLYGIKSGVLRDYGWLIQEAAIVNNVENYCFYTLFVLYYSRVKHRLLSMLS